MADNTPRGKWWPRSLTIWGALVTGIALVLPRLCALAGLDVSDDLARQIGEIAVDALQGFLGVTGTAMTIYGRARAAQPLVARARHDTTADHGRVARRSSPAARVSVTALVCAASVAAIAAWGWIGLDLARGEARIACGRALAGVQSEALRLEMDRRAAADLAASAMRAEMAAMKDRHAQEVAAVARDRLAIRKRYRELLRRRAVCPAWFAGNF